MNTNCQICGRQLTDSESIARGFGPDCVSKRAALLSSLNVTDSDLEAFASVPAAQRWVDTAFKAIRSGGNQSGRDARNFFNAARRAMPTYHFNEAAYHNTVEHLQERSQGDNVGIVLAVVDRKIGGQKKAKFGTLKGQQVELVTLRPLVSAGYDAFTQRPVLSVAGVHGPILAVNEWLSVKMIESIVRRTKAILPDGMPYQVRRFLLEGNNENSIYATPRVYAWLSKFYGKLSLSPGDAAARESARLADLARNMASERSDSVQQSIAA